MLHVLIMHLCVCVCRCCALQADTEELKLAWINAVQGCIGMAYRHQVTNQNTQVHKHTKCSDVFFLLCSLWIIFAYCVCVFRWRKTPPLSPFQIHPLTPLLWAWHSEEKVTCAVVTAGRRSLAGPVLIWASPCASSARASTGNVWSTLN